MILCADKVFIGNKTDVIENGAVMVRDNMILMVGNETEVLKAYPDEMIERYKGKSLLPGLIDLHTHIGFPYSKVYENEYNGESMRAVFAMNRMRETLQNGVTTIRDVASGNGIALALRQAGEDGFGDIPRIITCLKGICMTGGHGSKAMKDGIIEADGVEEIKKAVRTNISDGADWIKVLTSEGYRGVELSQEELNAAVKESHRLGRKIAAHAGYGPSIQMCIDAGFDSIEHGTYLTLKQAEYMKEHDMTWVPTIYVFAFIYDQICKAAGMNIKEYLLVQKKYLSGCEKMYKENVRAIYDTGIRIGVGTDTDCAGYPNASPVVKECEKLAECGLTTMEIIECATKNGAECLGMQEIIGQIKAGLRADLILVEGDPSVDISELGKVMNVFKDGKCVK